MNKNETSRRITVTRNLTDENILAIAELRAEHRGRSPEDYIFRISAAQDSNDWGEFFWLANLDEQPAGYAFALVRNERMGLNGVYTTERHRNTGIGKTLTKAQIEFAKDLRLKSIHTEIDTRNLPSMAVSQACGFDTSYTVGTTCNAVLWLNSKK